MAFQVVVASNKIKSRNHIVSCAMKVAGKAVFLQVFWLHTKSIAHHTTNFLPLCIPVLCCRLKRWSCNMCNECFWLLELHFKKKFDCSRALHGKASFQRRPCTWNITELTVLGQPTGHGVLLCPKIWRYLLQASFCTYCTVLFQNKWKNSFCITYVQFL